MNGFWWIFSSFHELMQLRGVRRPSVCPSVNFLCKSLLLPQTWLDRHQTCTRWSPHGHASRVCSRSRSRSKVTWYGHFCDVTKCLLYSTFRRCLYMHSLYKAPLHSPSTTTVRQLDVMSTSWNELLRHWRSGLKRWGGGVAQRPIGHFGGGSWIYGSRFLKAFFSYYCDSSIQPRIKHDNPRRGYALYRVLSSYFTNRGRHIVFLGVRSVIQCDVRIVSMHCHGPPNQIFVRPWPPYSALRVSGHHEINDMILSSDMITANPVGITYCENPQPILGMCHWVEMLRIWDADRERLLTNVVNDATDLDRFSLQHDDLLTVRLERRHHCL